MKPDAETKRAFAELDSVDSLEEFLLLEGAQRGHTQRYYG